MQEFDRPFFKQLAKNDTGQAKGKQAGIVIVKDLAGFFPQLALPSASNFAPDIRLNAAMFDGAHQVGLANTRYQYQSWGGTRLERRLTDNLGPIRSLAKKDDLLVMERSLSDPLFYRLTLHRAGTPSFPAILSKAAGRPWGPLDTLDPPVPETEIAACEKDQEEQELLPFDLFDNSAALHESRVKRIARNRAFGRRVLPLYDHRCAVCGLGHAGENIQEAEAAHIVPRGLKGADDARNGLALCRSHHWAFDAGLFGVGADRKVVINPKAAADARNTHLLPFDGQPIRDPSNLSLRPDLSALEWHLKNVAGL
ncbi:HNH endonuclease [Aminobacter sp. AP02]|uniref:HNH endonuclease n=1 Tax=Aminobacter sp. AP02 TaxID=2135737 RepID=UPI000D6B8B98|nr:HNH endonuclease [Aminobacter sp. AP02]PWK64625.1 putative restriction endonuclease [Aminobacter sp. AP02]